MNVSALFTFHGKIEDHANDVHDFLKYLKFGYGRATDDASMEIRHGRMTREEGIKMVRRYDAREPSTLQVYCDFLGITRRQFYDWVEPMRDERIWKKDKSGEWQPQDAVFKHENGEAERESASRRRQKVREPCPKKTGACTTTPLIHRK